MTTLHLVQPWTPAGSRRPRSATADLALAAVGFVQRSHPEHRHRPIVLGNSDAERRSHMLGLVTADRVPTPAGRAWLAWRGLRSFEKAHGVHRQVLWSQGARIAAASGLQLGSNATTMPEIPLDAALGLGRALAGDRDRRREQLGIARDALVLLLVSDPPDLADARRFCHTIGLLDKGGIRTVGLIGSGARHVDRARQFRRAAELESRIELVDAPALAAIGAADIAVVHGPLDGEYQPAHADGRSHDQWTGSLIGVCLGAGAVTVAPDAYIPRLLAALPTAMGAKSWQPVDVGCCILTALDRNLHALRADAARVLDAQADNHAEALKRWSTALSEH